MSSPSDIIAEKERELENLRKQMIERQKQESVTPAEETLPDKTTAEDDDKKIIVTEVNETEMPSFNVKVSKDPYAQQEFSSAIFVGANCPKCDKMLGYQNLMRGRSTEEIAYYKCPDDRYIAIRSHN